MKLRPSQSTDFTLLCGGIFVWHETYLNFRLYKKRSAKEFQETKKEGKVLKKLTGRLTAQLSAYEVTDADIIFFAKADIDENFGFADTFYVLTRDRLITAAYPESKKNKIHSFGGYMTGVNDEADKENLEAAIRIFEVGNITKLAIIREISGGAIYAETAQGDVRLGRFTNSRMNDMQTLVKLFEKLKNGEEIKEEDINGKNKMECCPKCGLLYPDQERRICPKCMDKKSIMLRGVGYYKPYIPQVVIMFLCYILSAALNLVWPYLSGTVLYDRVLAKDEMLLAFLGLPAGRFTLLLGVMVLGMLSTKIMLLVLEIIPKIFTARMVPEIVARLKEQIFSSMGRLSISFYNSRQTGSLMTRVLEDADEVTGFCIDGVPYFFVNIMVIVSTCVIMFMINPWMAIASLVLLPFLAIISYRMMPRLWSFYGKRHRANRRLNSQMNDNFTGARVVKAFGQEDMELKRFGKRNGGVREAELSVAGYDNKYYALYSAVENIASFMVWGLGSLLILNGSGLELGVLITFAGYVGQLNNPLDFMSHLFRWCTNSLNSAQRIFEIIDAVPEVRESENPIRPDYINGSLKLENVTFGYEPHKPVLKDVSFEVKAGEMLGIVGRSGAGKSTLVNLISRLYDTNEGNIYVDGINVRDLGFKELRKSIAMVSQETYIFMGTVAENIAYARPDATRKEIMEAAIMASAHDFICKMPEGYDTVLGSSGRSLSGGEKQRISIARAILANPRILILDEATSAVDTETELAIQESLEKLIVGRTTLSIAHRLSTLRNADKLIVIDDGKVTESGTHEELIAKKGTFYKLMELQTKALAMRGLE